LIAMMPVSDGVICMTVAVSVDGEQECSPVAEKPRTP
jgi:hypothetical protein